MSEAYVIGLFIVCVGNMYMFVMCFNVMVCLFGWRVMFHVD